MSPSSGDKPRQFARALPYQSVRSLSPMTPGSFPRFPSAGATTSPRGTTALSMDSFSAHPVQNRITQKTIDPFSSSATNFGSPLPDVLPASMSMRSSYTGGRATSPSAGVVVGLPENDSVRLGIPSMSTQQTGS